MIEALGAGAIAGIGVLALLILLSVRTVDQGKIAVVTMFGKYRRILRPGLNFILPLFQRVAKTIPVQNRSVELGFQAITMDQANVYFKAMILYTVKDAEEETIKAVAFKFVSDQDFMTALVRSVEGSVRGYVATQRQAEILGKRTEITHDVKGQLDNVLEGWGYHLIDVQLNDITFDPAITESMARVVASNNLKAAATNEGDALRIRKTKEAEAEGAAITIAATAERESAQLRGQGVALFREEVARGLAMAAKELKEENVDQSLILFSMWTEAIRHVAETGKGNVIFFDGSVDGMEKTMRQLMGMQRATGAPPPPPPAR
jgi:regulator of protease activity HflC (stomatin/prohibitin superfamily)